MARATRQHDPTNQLAQTAPRIYDAVGRLEQAIGADNQTTRWEYDGNGNGQTRTAIK